MFNRTTAIGVNTADYTDYIDEILTGGALKPEQPGTIDFSSVLAGAMKNQIASATVTAGGGLTGMMPNTYLPVQNQGIEQAVLSAASSGQVDDAQIALLMLCMMMQSNQDGDFSMLMQMMGTMLTQIQGDKEKLRSNVMSAQYDPYVLDMIDKGVFSTGLPNTTGTDGTVAPVEQWKPTVPAIAGNTSFRNPDLYRAVINQFQVETTERYRPFRDGNTYCNIYVWDVTRAMGAEIPLYTDPETGAPRYYPDIKGAKSMGAIAMDQWLSEHGSKYGWFEVGAEAAQKHANLGKPAVTTAGSLGHVQIVCPSKDGEYDPIRGVAIAQAGRIVTSYTHISGIYGSNSLNSKVRYWIHK